MSIDPIASKLAADGVTFAPEIAAAARRYALDPDLLAAIAAQETGGPDTNAGHNVVGDGAHGHGLFQIDDRSHPFAATRAVMDPAQNADYAAGMISGLLKRYGGNVREALSAYNTGSPTASGTETRWSDGRILSYADSVMRHYRDLTGESPRSSARAESGTAIASVGALRTMAQRLPPAPPPTPPSLGGQSREARTYRRDVTDYMALLSDDNDENNS